MKPSAQEIEAWIVERVCRLAELPSAEIDVHASLFRHGLDSIAVLALAGDLEKWLNYRFQENPLEEHPTIADLAAFLAKEVGREES